MAPIVEAPLGDLSPPSGILIRMSSAMPAEVAHQVRTSQVLARFLFHRSGLTGKGQVSAPRPIPRRPAIPGCC